VAQIDSEKYAVATQLQLTWWRFKRHRLAMVSLVVLALFYLMALFADFLATTDPHATDARTSYIAPQPIHWFDEEGFNPHVYGIKGVRDMRTFKLVYTIDPSRKVYIDFFGRGYEYNLFGLIPTDRHLMTLRNPERGDGIYILGTDLLGRDLWSRLMVATRVSLTIGLVGVTISLFLGVLLGIRAAMIAVMLKKREPYYRLLIGTSDGRQIPLVDNNRDVLVKVRDVVRYKLDTSDTSITGDFDLNLDSVNLRLPKGAAMGAAAPAPEPQSAPQEDDVFDGPRLTY
jgi:hypothetical protein